MWRILLIIKVINVRLGIDTTRACIYIQFFENSRPLFPPRSRLEGMQLHLSVGMVRYVSYNARDKIALKAQPFRFAILYDAASPRTFLLHRSACPRVSISRHAITVPPQRPDMMIGRTIEPRNKSPRQCSS